MAKLIKQSKNLIKNQNWKADFEKSIEKSKKENEEIRKEIVDLEYRMLKVAQALNIRS